MVPQPPWAQALAVPGNLRSGGTDSRNLIKGQLGPQVCPPSTWRSKPDRFWAKGGSKHKMRQLGEVYILNATKGC